MRPTRQLTGTTGLEKMIQTQLVDRGINDLRVLEAIRAIPRELFFPTEIKQFAYADKAAPIGHGQTISQPYIVALMTQRLDPQPADRVLEIGTGSGYQTAILSKLSAEVFTVERVKPLLDATFERLLALGLRNLHFKFADGSLGWPSKAPFDRILIAAGMPDLPRQLLLEQLRDGGTAVLPVGPHDQQMLVQVKRHGDTLHPTDIAACRFVKLLGQNAWPLEDQQ